MTDLSKAEQEIVEQVADDIVSELMQSCDNCEFADAIEIDQAKEIIEIKIRAHNAALIGAMREACAKQADDVADAYNVELPDGDLVGHAAASGIAEKIRSLTDLAADEAIERIKAAAEKKGQIAQGTAVVEMWKSGMSAEMIAGIVGRGIAALSGKEPAHD